MLDALSSLLAWIPINLRVFAVGAFAIFFIVTLLRMWAFIKDLIPFL